MGKGVMCLMWCFVVMVVIFTKGTAAVTYNVGDKEGWRIPSKDSFYKDWADTKTFRVGDELSFSWTDFHDVAKVTEGQYDKCVKATPLDGKSPLVVPLNATGDHYFICTIGAHCQAGQKLKVEVEVSNSPSTPGSPPSTTTSPPSTTATSPPSSSSSFVPIATLSAATFALVFSFLY